MLICVQLQSVLLLKLKKSFRLDKLNLKMFIFQTFLLTEFLNPILILYILRKEYKEKQYKLHNNQNNHPKKINKLD